MKKVLEFVCVKIVLLILVLVLQVSLTNIQCHVYPTSSPHNMLSVYVMRTVDMSIMF